MYERHKGVRRVGRAQVTHERREFGCHGGIEGERVLIIY